MDEQIRRVHAADYSVYGARKVRRRLQREGHPSPALGGAADAP
ncbi:hypothetical protein [Nonomuraea zeae]